MKEQPAFTPIFESTTGELVGVSYSETMSLREAMLRYPDSKKLHELWLNYACAVGTGIIAVRMPPRFRFGGGAGCGGHVSKDEMASIDSKKADK